MKLKTILATSMALLLSVSAVACNPSDILGSAGSAIGEATGTSLSGEALYSALDSAISSPTGSSADDLYGKTITFAAYVLTDPEVMSFDEEEGGDQSYVYAAIYRNDYSEVMINVDKLSPAPIAGDYIQVTGSVIGSIYGTVDNERVEFLDFKADSYTPYTPTESYTTAPSFTVTDRDQSGTIEILGSYLTQDSFEEPAIICYFNFTNDSSESMAPPLDFLDFYCGNSYLEVSSSFFTLDDPPRSDALEGDTFADEVYAGKTQLYYVVLSPDLEDPELSFENYLYVDLSDDEFNWLVSVEVPIADSNDNIQPPTGASSGVSPDGGVATEATSEVAAV